MGWPRPLISGSCYGLMCAVMALIGDLTVSLLKRSAGLKDTGSILPGSATPDLNPHVSNSWGPLAYNHDRFVHARLPCAHPRPQLSSHAGTAAYSIVSTRTCSCLRLHTSTSAGCCPSSPLRGLDCFAGERCDGLHSDTLRYSCRPNPAACAHNIQHL